ncbi:putative HVA22-like protein g [Cornus florida]|uniref:putative HVA22-like protein g n=1 Tax=Cornus florida TaxID=4283 RepID=UPI002896FF5C|nr:putative HVA22-like protein g [Cornus florida]
MLGTFLTRSLLIVFGYAYPAYECFKTVEKKKPKIEQLLFWCQYWILVAVITVCERVVDNLFSWLPLYGEAKIALFIYLWYPSTKGSVYVYKTFFRPYVASHEREIDHNLLEVKNRVRELRVLLWHKAGSYGQIRFFDILRCG